MKRGAESRKEAVAKTVVRRAQPKDRHDLARLREALWPESSAAEHAKELQRILARAALGATPLVVFVADSNGKLVGFLEAGLRSHAESCDPANPVGYVEGWYVAESHRRRGIGRSLLDEAESWARQQGCKEMASDAQMHNEISQRVHDALATLKSSAACIIARR
jgi:aminoglycoside 6'-N-acetyltransferase I